MEPKEKDHLERLHVYFSKEFSKNEDHDLSSPWFKN